MARNKKIFFTLEDRIVLDAAALISSMDVVNENDAHVADGAYEQSYGESNPLENIVENAMPVTNNRVVILDERADPKGEIFQYLSQKNIAVHVIGQDEDGVNAVSNVLSQYQLVETLDIISHGSEGEVSLGATVLNNSTVEDYLDELRSWSNSFSETADLMIYGCDVASGADGVYFIQRIAEATGADVSASNDLTGQGGDWALEVLLGDVESKEIIGSDIYADITLTNDDQHENGNGGDHNNSQGNSNGNGHDNSNGQGHESHGQGNGYGHDHNHDEPEAEDVEYSTVQGVAVEIELEGSDPGPNNDHLLKYKFTEVPNAQNVGSFMLNGQILNVGDEISHSEKDDIVFVPVPSFHGNLSYEYVAIDPDGNVSDEAEVHICVSKDNHDPVAYNKSFTINEGESLKFHIYGQDPGDNNDHRLVYKFIDLPDSQTEGVLYATDDDGNILTDSQGNQIVIDSDYEITHKNRDDIKFIPVENFSGVIQFTYKSIDPAENESQIATVTINVNPLNDAPVAVGDDVRVDAGTKVVIDVLANDTDADGDDLTIQSVSNVLNGVAVIVDGKVEFTPDENFVGVATFDYVVVDEHGETSTASVEVEVSPIANILFEAPQVGDENPLEDHVSFDMAAGSDYQFSTDSEYFDVANFHPDDNHLIALDFGIFSGYKVQIDQSLIDNGDITIYRGANDSHKLWFYGSNESIEIALNSMKVSSPSSGGVSDDFVVCLFRSQDGGSYKHIGADRISITSLSPIDAVDDSFSVFEDQTLSISSSDLLSNDSGVGVEIISFTQPQNGVITQNQQGDFIFTPDSDFNGQTSFTYVIEDDNGDQSTATVNINVHAVADDLILVDDSYEENDDDNLTSELIVEEGSELDILVSDLLANDVGVDDFPEGAYLVIDSLPENGTLYLISEGNLIEINQSNINDITLSPDSQLRYIPNENANGEDVFSYSMRVPFDGFDGLEEFPENYTHGQPNGTGVDAITVDGVGEYDVSVSFVQETAGYKNTLGYYIYDDAGNILNTQIIWNSIENGQPDFDLSSLSEGQNLGFFLVADGGSSVFSNSNPEVRFVNNQGEIANYNDASSSNSGFQLQYKNSNGNWVNYTSSNNKGVFHSNSASLNLDGFEHVISGVVEGDDGDKLLQIAFEDLWSGGGQSPDWDTSDLVFTVRISEQVSNSADVKINITSVNDAPDAVDDSIITNEDESVNISVLSNDSDVDGDALTVTAASVDASEGSVEINSDGTLKFTPASDFNGDATITYTISDGHGGEDTATVTVTVNPINDAPDAVDDSIITNEDESVNISVLSNDSDVDGDALTVTAASVDASEGSVEINSDGTLKFTPASDFNGDATITYTISDGHGGEDTATVTVTVNPINDAPDAVDDSIITNEDESVNISVLSNDSDVDGDALTVTAASVDASEGSVEINSDGTLKFTPASDFNGDATITYTISDGHGGEDTATVTVTVNPINDAPDAVDDSIITNEDESVNISVLSNDSDVDGDALTVTAASVDASEGSVEINSDGTLKFTPASDFNGDATITYTISDGHGGEDTATVTVTVNPINDAPDAVDDSIITNEDESVNISVLSNDSDVDGDALTVTAASVDASEGSVEINSDGTLKFTPASDFNGDATITYTISDGHGGEDTATVTVTVNPINDAPDAVDDSIITNEDESVNISVLSNDSDVDGDALTVTAASVDASEGSVEINSDGTLKFTPASDFNGDATITYTISDGHGGEDTATVTVTVNPINDAPDAVDDSIITNEDESVNISVLSNDSDVDGDALTVTAASVDASEGSVEINSDGTLKFTPASDFNGDATITYTISDGHGGEDTATVTVTVNPINDAPDAVDDSIITNEDESVNISVLSNDSDVDGDALTVTAASVDASEGSVEINSDGTLKFTPASDFNGDATITYTISDGHGGEDTATVTVTVNPINDAPDAVDDSIITNEDESVNISVLSNDSDVDGDALTVTAASVDASEGSVEINSDGTLKFTPASDFNGDATITYTISDGHGGEDTATVTVTVNPINDAPDAVDDSIITNEDESVNISVLSNDSDVDGDALTVTAASVDASEGSVEINSDGTLKFTPASDFNGDATITYTISDGHGGEDTATVTVTVNPINDAPDAVDDSIITNEDESVNISVLSNDSDVDGDALTVTAASVDASEGSVEINSDGTLKFTPASDFNGDATITYTISDGHGGEDTATVTVTVNPINDAPDAVDDSIITNEDESVNISVLSNDSDVDGDALTVTAASVDASEGSVEINSDGTLKFTPASDFNGDATITYTISDGHGGEDTATVTVTVNPINDAPDAVDDSIITNEDESVNISVLSNDSDVDGDALTVTAASVDASEGSVEINSDGTLKFTPASDFNGDATITYTISDGHGGEDTATVTVTVNPINDAPDAVDDSIITNEDESVNISVLSNDSDVDGDALTVTAASVDASEGSVEINSDGTLKFTPASDFNGDATITYTISDGHGGEDTATVTVTVNPINDAPDAVDDSIITNEDESVNISVLSNDSDVDGDALTVTAASVDASEGSVEINSDGTLKFTPASDFNGDATITYTISDGHGGEDTATVTVTVNPINDAPDAVDDSIITNEDESVNISVLSNDSDVDGDALTVTAASVDASEGSVEINSDGTLKFTPASDFNGDATITYTISDGHGGEDTATVTVTVNPINDAPDAVDDSIITNEDESVNISVLSNDSDVDGDALTVTAASVDASEGSVEINSDGTLKFTPASDFNGDATITYTISDGHGGEDTATVTVTVNPINDAPDAVDDSIITNEDESVNISVLSNDSDVDGDALTVTAASVDASEGSVEINSDGTLKFTPASDFNGDATITYTISDGHGGEDTATVTVTVNPINDAPDAVDDSIITNEDESVNISVLSNDSDVDGDALTVTAASVDASEGSVEINSDGTLKFTPASDFNGDATITYTISDGHGGEDTATVTVTVNPINDAPDAVDDSIITNEDESVNISVLSNDSDVDGDALTVTAASVDASEGSVEINSDGTLKFTPASDFNGDATITYTISDGHGGEDTATVTVTVNPINDAPDAVDDSIITNEDESVNISVLSNDSDVDGDALTVTAASVDASEGSVEINSDGTLKFTPASDFNGDATITYTISDGHGGEDTATVTVTVNPINDAPDAVDDSIITNEDESVNISVLSNDSDVDGDALTVTAASVDASEGSVEINSDGTLKFTPASDFNGDATITYTISDGHGGEDTATVTVTVNPINDAPDAVDDSIITNEDESVNISVLSNDSDVDGDALTVTAASVDASEGSVEINSDGTLKFTPASDFNGDATITYTISDGHGGEDTATVTVTVNPINDAPDAVDDSIITNEDESVNISVLSNDSDVDGDALTVTAASVDASEGSVEINSDGTLKFTPASDFNGDATITYTISDGHGGEDTATVTVTVNPINDAPDAVDDSIITNEDESVNISVLSNDSDVDGDALTVTAASVDASEGSVEINSDGTLKFTPASDFNGDATITYTISDGHGGEDTATVTVTVNPINDAPDAVDDSIITNEDESVNISVLSNDSDVDGDALTVTAASVDASEGSVEINSDGTLKFTPASDFNGDATITYTISDGHGGEDTATVTVTVNPINDAPDAVDDSIITNEDESVNISVLSNDSDVDGDALTVTAASVDASEGSVEINSDGTLKFTPASDFNGDATITYTISDGHGGEDTATVTVTVNPINDAPDAVDDSIITNEDESVNISVLSNDSDVDGDALTVTAASVDASEGSVEINSDGTLKFTPASDFNGDATITYTISDGHGGEDTATVTVTVNPINDAPDAVDDSIITNEDESVNISVLSNDSDVDGDALTVTAASVDASEGSVEINSDGTLKFTPASDFNGDATITYTISDGHGGEDTATVTVTVNPINDAPDAVDDSIITNEDESVNISVLSNDSDVDGDALTVTAASVDASEGSVEINSDGTLKFTPASDFNGDATITYTISDGHGGEDTATVTVTVNPINDAPDAVDDSIITNEDESVNISVLSNDSDVDGDALTVTAASVDASEGSVEINSDGTLKFTPASDFNGDATITYTISDGHGGEDTATVTVTVNPINDAPDAVDDSIITNEDESVNISVLSNDSDVDGDALTVTAASVDASEGSVEINSDGTLKFTPASDFNGDATITYTISDGHGGEDTATVTVTVNPINDAPDAVDDSIITNEDESVNISVLSNDSDVDGDALTVTAASVDASEGSVEINSDGTLKFTPASDFNGDATITYTISDGHGGEDTATVTVTVNPINDAPDLEVPGELVLQQDETLLIDGISIDDIDSNGDDLKVTINSSSGAGLTLGSSVGVVVNSGAGFIEITGSKDAINAALKTLVYNPSSLGPDNVNVVVSDLGNNGQDPSEVGLPNTGTETDERAQDSFVVTVNSSLPPSVVDLTEVTNEDIDIFNISVLEDLANNDSSIESFVLNDFPAVAQGVIYINGVAQSPFASPVNINLSQAANIDFVPASDFNGNVVIKYQAVDEFGNTSEQKNITIDVQAVNDAPVINSTSSVILAQSGEILLLDGENLISVDDIDSDSDDVRVRISSNNGSLFVTNLSGVVVTGNNSGLITITGDKASVNNALESLGFLSNTGGNAVLNVFVSDLGNNGIDPEDVGQIFSSDNSEEVDTAVVNINVNQQPIANNDSAVTTENKPVVINLLANDSDADSSSININNINQPSNGTVVVLGDGIIRYIPNGGFSGFDSFTYNVADEDGGISTLATVVVEVRPDTIIIDDIDLTPPSPPPFAGNNGGDSGSGEFSDQFNQDSASSDNSLIKSLNKNNLQPFEQLNYDLRLLFDLPDVVLRTDTVQEFSIPNGAFVHNDTSAKISYEATLPDGSALPSWILFDEDKAEFIIKPPSLDNQSIEILVVAKDDKGNEASSTFTVLLVESEDVGVNSEENIEGDNASDNALKESIEEFDEELQAMLEELQQLSEFEDDVYIAMTPFSKQLESNLQNSLDDYAMELIKDLYHS